MIVVACSPAAAPSPPAAGQAQPPAAPAAQPAAGQPAATGPAPSTGAGQAWEDEWKKTIEAAKKESLVVVTHPGGQYQKLISHFKTAFPDIPVEHSGVRPSDISPKIISEQQNGVFNWDVMVATTSNMNQVLLPANVFQDLRQFILLPDAKDDSKWGGGKFEMFTSESGPYILVHNASLTSNLFVNRDKVSKDQLASIDDLLKPEFKGQIVVDDCTVPAHGLGALVGLMQARGEDFIRNILTQQQPVFQDTVRITTEWVATGRYPIGIGVDQPELLKLQTNGIGKNVEQMTYKGGNLSTQGSAVFKSAPHPNAAKVFLNWFWTKEGQLAWLDGFSDPPPTNSRRLDVPIADQSNYPDYRDLTQYTSWSMDSGRGHVAAVSKLCKDLRP